ncbi:PAS domain-containing protein [Mucilaginibacter sp.]|uniref:PAS domain-containing protein n=1 Tax=Mucilaginibacter sp. TaxID=1882438 RepID=UPI003D09F42A
MTQIIDDDIRFRKLVENSYEGITLLDKNLNVVYRSLSAEKISGWNATERVKTSLIDLVHPDERESVKQLFADLLNSPGSSKEYIFRSRKSDGHYVWLECIFTNMLNDPDIKAIVSNFRDITEKKQAELEIKKKTEQIEDILDSITDGFIALDENMCYTYANKRVGKMLGINIETLIGKNVWDLFPDAFGSATYQAINTALTDKIYVCNEDYYAPLGLWQENRVYPSGSGVSVFIRDITERKNLEGMLNKATDLARIGGWEMDLQKQVVHWSDITRQIHECEPGYSPDLQTAINFYKEGENRNIIARLVKEAIENGTPWDVELQMVTAKGNVKWIRDIGEAQFADGKCVRLYGSFQDIDARKKAEVAEIHALEERNVILESIGDAFFAVDKNWIVTYWNKMAEKIMGKPKQQVLNRNLWTVYHDAVKNISFEKYHEAMETMQAVHFEDYYEPLALWFDVSAYPSYGGLSVYFKDITDRKLSEIRLKEQNEQLREISWIQSHIVRAPLARIMGLIPLIKDPRTQVADKQEMLEYLLVSAVELDDVIRSITDKTKQGTYLKD